ncbi:hypothetical protein LCGC14_0194790 [marine sediment metagenome]|uniref:Uncharacterized protein n=1 Tax=marine sediment metagenome TaxID=412755 RepID=A0A0F9V1P6_9ZZZZ
MTRDYRRAQKGKPVTVKHKRKKVSHGTEKKLKGKTSLKPSFDFGKKKKSVKTVKSPRKVKALKLPSNSEAIVHSLLSPTKNENEQLVLIRHRPTGDTVYFVQEGDNASLTTDSKYYSGKKKSMTEIHTHPRNSPHSDEDLWTLLSHDQVKKSEVLTSNDIIFIMEKSKSTPPASQIDREEFDNNWKQSIEEATELHSRMKEMPTGAQQDSDRAFYIIVNQKMAEKYGLKWDVAKREEQIAAHAEKTMKHFELSDDDSIELIAIEQGVVEYRNEYKTNPTPENFERFQRAIEERDDLRTTLIDSDTDRRDANLANMIVDSRRDDVINAAPDTKRSTRGVSFN